VREVGPDTSADDIRSLDRMTQGCDVLLPMGSFLRGQQRPSVFLFARDGDGRVVGDSGAVAQFHPDHPKAERFWWGMLATDERRRGQGIAIVLGAMALLRMREKFGYTRRFTGNRAGNGPSEALCTKLGLRPDETTVLIAIDPQMFSGGRITK
jgi:RimJ/RimL family protein N-acetyltransferase